MACSSVHDTLAWHATVHAMHASMLAWHATVHAMHASTLACHGMHASTLACHGMHASMLACTVACYEAVGLRVTLDRSNFFFLLYI